ncbi:MULTISPECIES: mannose/fructose/sorbose PTS transporter subunit IIB [Lactobacillaceae]|jgi:PTS system sorbose-specific IIB component|uniref:mannose/fructose/sorbose PTS transporter subunit IIB n=1 Tax=Lactobacillaceae TaxID=33958 RepID=UPI0005E90C1C|nr:MULTISPECIES: mannose/fructose/sorbose PTS transporter subunit IIB [Lactobacillaceae]KRN39788.1 PTS enzyme IIAB, mannose-specific [Lactiplantibacillus plantarum]MBS0940916.1 PTS sugar transporter subunit IIB [Lactiplantibacillus plantarum]MCG0690879.1 PTS fructose transporter subunit IIB [Lactiplantibacillus plantarum]MCG0715614.1 PTS fructose transporter subunit IIB [Lactiplantibacillus plantarum]MCG0942084.1 PTS fructose transporter subunit IIB [Lactiplantibacillus plantarum]
MIVTLARIDDRLIHGQVTTVWSKESGADRIIIVSGEVYKDTIRKTLLKQACPPGMKVNIVDVQKAIAVFNNPKYANDKVFYLFTNPTEALELVQGGVKLDTLNIGGMQFSEGRTQITKSVSLDQKDVDSFRALDKLGVKLDLQVIKTDPHTDMIKKINETFDK